MPKLSYFAAYGRAEPIRCMLAAAKVEYENEFIEFADWPAIKGDTERFPLGSMPVMSDSEGNVHCQSLAIARMIAINHGFYSTEPMEAYLIDSLVDGSVDVEEPSMGDI